MTYLTEAQRQKLDEELSENSPLPSLIELYKNPPFPVGSAEFNERVEALFGGRFSNLDKVLGKDAKEPDREFFVLISIYRLKALDNRWCCE